MSDLIPDEELRMDAYYYGFHRTGVIEIDRILSAVARAGKAFHLTEDWNEPAYGGDTSPVDWIQSAANDAAAGFRRVSPVTREAVKQMLAENGFTPNGGHPHSWRCEHPDRYPGSCRCVDEMTDDIMRLLSVSPPAEVTRGTAKQPVQVEVITAAELDALNLDAVVVDRAGVPRTKRAGNSHMPGGWTHGGNSPLTSTELADGNPMTVVYAGRDLLSRPAALGGGE